MKACTEYFLDGSEKDYSDRLLQNYYEKGFFQNQDSATAIRFVVLLMFFIFLGVLGRRRRMKTRFAILKARAQDDRLQFGGGSIRNKKAFVRENQYDGACSHTLCGCYPVDPTSDDEEEQDLFEHEKNDFLNRAFSAFSYICCGRCCKVWFQCFSM